MLAKIVWEVSGDEILFSTDLPDLLHYYVEQLNKRDANRFKFKHSEFDLRAYQDLKQNLLSTSKIAQQIPLKIDQWDGNLLDQQYLNKLHRQWVKTGIEYPKIPLLLRSLGGLDEDYRNINTNLHKLEKGFKYSFANYDVDQFQVENIFGKKILKFDQTNLMLGFDNLGRSSWDKYKNFDNNADDNDTNDFQNLSGLVHLNLDRPMTMLPPREYVEWCQHHNMPLVGRSLNLGNIVDLENKLTDLRKILIRNTYEQNDQFFFETCSQ